MPFVKEGRNFMRLVCASFAGMLAVASTAVQAKTFTGYCYNGMFADEVSQLFTFAGPVESSLQTPFLHR